MPISFNAQCIEPGMELVSRFLPAVVGDHNAADIEADPPERVDQAEGILIIGNAQVTAAFGAFNVIRGNGENNFQIVLHLQKHFYLAVRLKPGKDTGGMIVVKQLPAKLQVQLSAEPGNPVFDALRL